MEATELVKGRTVQEALEVTNEEPVNDIAEKAEDEEC